MADLMAGHVVVISDNAALTMAFSSDIAITTVPASSSDPAKLSLDGCDVVVVDAGTKESALSWLRAAASADPTVGLVLTPSAARSLASTTIPPSVVRMSSPSTRAAFRRAIREASGERQQHVWPRETAAPDQGDKAAPGPTDETAPAPAPAPAPVPVPAEDLAAVPDESPINTPHEPTSEPPSDRGDLTITTRPTPPAAEEWVPPLMRRILNAEAAEAIQATPDASSSESATDGPAPGPATDLLHAPAATSPRGPRRTVPRPSRRAPGWPSRGGHAGQGIAGRQPAAPWAVADALGVAVDNAAEILPLPLVADAVAADLADSLSADAAAVMLQDSEYYRTVGGFALRPAERRGSIPRDHWLVTAVVRREQALIVENTEVARRQLQGAPLASRTHLLAVPAAGLSCLIVAARSDEPFAEDDLAAAARSAQQATPYLLTAARARDLLRILRDGERGHLAMNQGQPTAPEPLRDASSRGE
jgi:hypothetical protein